MGTIRDNAVLHKEHAMVKTTVTPYWYNEEAGFFGVGYLDAYAHVLTPERTEAEVNFITKVFSLPRGSKILDLACGHGRHTIALARRGYRMTGQDINAFFLKKAKRAAKRARVEVRWVQSDMREIPFEEEFAGIVNLFTSFGYLESDAEDQKVINEVGGALRPRGKFVLDVINREWRVRNFRERDWQELSNGSVIITERRFDFASGRNYERKVWMENNGKRKEVKVMVRLYTLAELVEMCEHAGLRFKEVYGNYAGEPLNFDSRRCILITEKPVSRRRTQ